MAVPTLDRVWVDQAVAAQLLRQASDERGEECRSAQLRRGVGLARRSTVTSCRNTSSSDVLG